MLRIVSDSQGIETRATDGSEVGSVDEFYFDDESWTIRYLVVDTGKWLPGRQVLISPISLSDSAWAEGVLNVRLTQDQIRNSPSIDTNRTVSRQHEAEHSRYYGYPYYWQGGGLWGAGAHPLSLAGQGTMGYPDRVGVATGYAAGPARTPETVEPEEHGDPHLRSTKEVIGYYVEAMDGDIGHIQDFIFDDQTWSIRYLVIDTVNWWPGKKVVIAPQWIKEVSWAQGTVYVDLERERIKNAPEYDATAILNRGYEDNLYDFYGQPKYWS